MDMIYLCDIEITRVCYKTRVGIMKSTQLHRDTRMMEADDIGTLVQENGGQFFDLICLDPFHEMYESRRDLEMCFSMLSPVYGILLCHDCAPKTLEMAYPYYQEAGWSGVTYAALIDMAYRRPELSYLVLDTDTGIAMVTKDMSQRKPLNREKQELFITLWHQKKWEDMYHYFRHHGKQLINLTTDTDI